MTTEEMVKNVARRIDGCSKSDVRTVLDVYADIIKEYLTENPDDYIPFPGIGRFSTRYVAARSSVSNLNGETYEKPEKTVLKFSVFNSIKNLK